MQTTSIYYSIGLAIPAWLTLLPSVSNGHTWVDNRVDSSSP